MYLFAVFAHSRNVYVIIIINYKIVLCWKILRVLRIVKFYIITKTRGKRVKLKTH
jgi:hypothetical protein